jgi:hypothetical protein
MEEIVGSRFVRLGVVLVAALVLAPSALAAKKQFWFGPYDAIGQHISGISDMQVLMEDDYAEWNSIESSFGVPAGEALLGFAAPSAASGSVLYHRIFLAPSVTLALQGILPLNPAGTGTSPIWDRINSGALSPHDAAMAILVVIHEAYHYKLNSGDEARVNACSLRDMPNFLTSEFRIPATITTTTQVPQLQTKTTRVPYYVTVVKHKKVNGKTVTIRTKERRYKTVTTQTTVMVSQTTSNPNPVFTNIMNEANAFRNSQPPPYNAGTCT